MKTYITRTGNKTSMKSLEQAIVEYFKSGPAPDHSNNCGGHTIRDIRADFAEIKRPVLDAALEYLWRQGRVSVEVNNAKVFDDRVLRLVRR